MASPRPDHGDAPDRQRVVLLSARDPLRAADTAYPARVAAELAADGHEVTLVLLEDAVVLARRGHAGAEDLEGAIGNGVVVLAESEALARRAVERVGAGVEPTDLAAVVDLLMTRSDRQAWL